MIDAEPRLEQGLRFRWQRAPRADADQLGALNVEQPLLAQLLHNRGIDDAESARRLLRAEHEALAPTASMAGLPEAVERLAVALDSGELIALYGDYDVDGLTATGLLASVIVRLGGRVLPFIPHRERDGYGLQDGPLGQLRAAGATLLVTLDCGVTAVDEIA